MANSVDSDGPPTDWAQVAGYGMPQDPKQAAYWYRQAADKGHPEAQFNLGRLYATGTGVKRDEEQAARWVSASAAQGYAPAQADLGARYAAGNGVAKDDQRAYFWLTLAFLHGDKSVEKPRDRGRGQTETRRTWPIATVPRRTGNRGWCPPNLNSKIWRVPSAARHAIRPRTGCRRHGPRPSPAQSCRGAAAGSRPAPGGGSKPGKVCVCGNRGPQLLPARGASPGAGAASRRRLWSAAAGTARANCESTDRVRWK